MQTYVAERSEILRGAQKDDEFLNELQQSVSDLLKRVGGDALWIRFYKYLQPATKLLYYGCTSIADVQTLGEEYLGLVQVQDQSTNELPTIWRRLLWVFLETSGPMIIEQNLRKWKQLDDAYYQRQQNGTRRIPLIRIIASALLRHLTLATIQRLHLAVFYLFASRFYSVWKRVAGIKYVTIRSQTDIKMDLVFKIIGASFLVQFILSVVTAARKDVMRTIMLRSQTPKNKQNVQDGSFYCDICLNSDDPVSTPCGHIYCFDCILFHSEHAGLDATLGQCPQCRLQFELRSIVPLLNL